MTSAEDSPQPLLHPAILQEVLRRLEATSVEELDVTDGTSRLFIRRAPGQRFTVVPTTGISPETDRTGVPVIAPLTGVYYSRPSPDQGAFVTPGEMVEVGQVVALIETMKLFNEVTAEVSGEVQELLARDGDLVEVGKPLFYVLPADPDSEA